MRQYPATKLMNLVAGPPLGGIPVPAKAKLLLQVERTEGVIALTVYTHVGMTGTRL